MKHQILSPSASSNEARWRRAATPVLFALLFTAISAVSSGAENLLPNPGFEQGMDEWTLWQPGERTVSVAFDTEIRHTGRVCLKIANPVERAKAANLFSTDVPCEPNATYTITVWAKTEHATRTAVALWGLDEHRETIKHVIGAATALPSNLDRFMRFSREVETPENCRYLRAHLLHQGGTVWWDSTEIRRGGLAPDPPIPRLQRSPHSPNMVPNSDFEEGTKGWNFWQKFPGQAQDDLDGEIKQSGVSSYKIHNSGVGGANVFTDNIPCKPNTVYTLSVWARTQNAKAAATAWAVDGDKQTISFGVDGHVDLPRDLPSFRRFSHTFRTPENCQYVRVHLTNGGGTVWWDSVQIEEGDTPSAYADGPSPSSYLRTVGEKGRSYSRAIIRHAETTSSLHRCYRLLFYLLADGRGRPDLMLQLEEASGLLEKAEEVLQAWSVAPDFMHLDYEAANALMSRAEGGIDRVRATAMPLLGTQQVSFSRAATLDGMVNKEQFTKQLCIFPLLGMGPEKATVEGVFGEILEPFGFRMTAPASRGGLQGGVFNFSRANELIATCASRGYKSDVQVEVAQVIHSLFEEFGDEIYLHTADGQWSERGGCHQMINIWHPEVIRMNNAYLTALGANFRENENVVCYELINEPSLMVSKWVERFHSEHLGPGGYSKAARSAWGRYLERKYGDIRALNARWGAGYAGFDEVDPPADLNLEIPAKLPDPRVPLVIEFNRFRMQSHERYFRDSIAALRKGDPNHPIMSQFISAVSRPSAVAVDLLAMASLDWDIFSTHDWPGDQPGHRCLYAYSMSRYAGKPLWEDEFIWPHWVNKGVDQRLVRSATERNLWRMVAWGKRGIHLFNLQYEWCAGTPRNWNNSILNVELNRLAVRYGTGAIKEVKDTAEKVAPLIFQTEIVNQEIAILQPTTALLSGIVERTSRRLAERICSSLLRAHWTPFFVPEECVLDGREGLHNFRFIILPYAVCAPEALQKKLLEYVEEGGHLALVGPMGVYDENGRRSLALLSAAFGISEAVHMESDEWEFEYDGRRSIPDALSRDIGQGRIHLLSPVNLRLESLDALAREAIPLKPVECPVDTIELVLRADPEGCRYLFATNLDYGGTVQTNVSIRGRITQILDLTNDCVRVPISCGEDDLNVVPVRLAPGETVLLLLRSREEKK